MRVAAFVVAGVVSLFAMPAGAQPVRLTLQEALARAREQSPEVIVARGRVQEAEGRLAGARIRFRENPSLEMAAGPRWAPGGTTTDLEFGASQLFETGGQRAARIAGAEAAIASEQAVVANTRREALTDVALAFLRALHARERARLLQSAQDTAADVERIASRRFQAGDIAVLDVNVARSSLARSRSARLSAEADRQLAEADLARRLGLDGVTVLDDGSLAGERGGDIGALLAALEQRPDLQALDAAVREAEADVRLGTAQKKPDLVAGLSTKREGSDTILLGGLTIAWPAFNSGQELRATGQARANRIRAQRDAAKAGALARLRGLDAAYQTRRAAAAAFEAEVLPNASENEQLAQRSFEEGELSVTELLVLRRELIEMRLEHVDRLLDAAETAMLRDSEAGVLR